LDVVGFLDYGALGLFALALVGVGIFLKNYFTRLQEQQGEREKADRQERKDLTDDFKELIQADVKARESLTATLEGLCNEVRACSGVQDVLEKMLSRMEQHEKRADARFRESMKTSEEILTSLRALNGKR